MSRGKGARGGRGMMAARLVQRPGCALLLLLLFVDCECKTPLIQAASSCWPYAVYYTSPLLRPPPHRPGFLPVKLPSLARVRQVPCSTTSTPLQAALHSFM